MHTTTPQASTKYWNILKCHHPNNCIKLLKISVLFKIKSLYYYGWPKYSTEVWLLSAIVSYWIMTACTWFRFWYQDMFVYTHCLMSIECTIACLTSLYFYYADLVFIITLNKTLHPCFRLQPIQEAYKSFGSSFIHEHGITSLLLTYSFHRTTHYCQLF